MDSRLITEIRNEYIKNNKIASTDKDVYTPVLSAIEVHPESMADETIINDQINAICCDIESLDKEIIEISGATNALIINIKERINKIYKKLEKEKERLQDINLICNKYTDFAKVINLDESWFTGDYSHENGIFTVPTKEIKARLKIIAVKGNGYEGNKNVYNITEESFVSDIVDTSNRDHILDGDVLTKYEYSRITMPNAVSGMPSFVNFDAIEAKCTIEMEASQPINKIAINSDAESLIVSALQTSDDGITFKQVAFEVDIVKKSNQYLISNYINGSGIVAFQPAKYVRLTLQSNGYTNDTVAYEQSE